MKKSIFWGILVLFQCIAMYASVTEKAIVVVIPSYNNTQLFQSIPRYKLNLDSVFGQAYSNYRVIYIDDCSSDGTAQCVKDYVVQNGFQDRFTLIQNEKRYGPSRNRYVGVHLCDDDEIVILLDGDDFLTDDAVFLKINDAYSNPNVWVTYGQFKTVPNNDLSDARTVPASIVRDNEYRKFGWHYHSLKTFYAWLFKQVRLEDLLYEGKFYPISSDLAEFLPVMEMSGGRFKFIREIMYHATQYAYNEQKVYGKALQQKISKHILLAPPYKATVRVKAQKYTSGIDLHVYIHDKPQNFDAVLLSYKKNCAHNNRIFVYFEAHMFDQQEIVLFLVKYPHITFVPITSQDMAYKKILKSLHHSLNQYVFMLESPKEIKEHIDFDTMVKYLEATFAHVFYVPNIDIDIRDKSIHSFMHHLPLSLNERENVFAFQCKKTLIQRFNKEQLASLYRKDDIINAYTRIKPTTIAQCKKMYQIDFDEKNIGLIFEHQKIV